VIVLLDTQAFYLAAAGGINALPKRVSSLLTDEETERWISAISLVEIAIKNSLGKMRLTDEMMQQGVADLQLTVIPFEPRHAYRMFALPLHHRDPFDRLIIATAVEEGVPLVGADRQFRRYRGLKVFW